MVGEPAIKIESTGITITPDDTLEYDLPAVDIISENNVMRYTTVGAISIRRVGGSYIQDSSAVNQNEIIANEDVPFVEEPVIVYPNPTPDFLNLKFNIPIEKNVEASLFDLNGKLVRELIPSQQMPAGERDVQINVEGLTPGTYLLRFTSGDNINTKRVVIL